MNNFYVWHVDSPDKRHQNHFQYEEEDDLGHVYMNKLQISGSIFNNNLDQIQISGSQISHNWSNNQNDPIELQNQTNIFS